MTVPTVPASNPPSTTMNSATLTVTMRSRVGLGSPVLRDEHDRAAGWPAHALEVRSLRTETAPPARRSSDSDRPVYGRSGPPLADRHAASGPVAGLDCAVSGSDLPRRPATSPACRGRWRFRCRVFAPLPAGRRQAPRRQPLMRPWKRRPPRHRLTHQLPLRRPDSPPLPRRRLPRRRLPATLHAVARPRQRDAGRGRIARFRSPEGGSPAPGSATPSGAPSPGWVTGIASVSSGVP